MEKSTNKINLEEVNLQYYPFVSSSLVDDLWHLSLPNGDFRTVFVIKNVLETLQAIVAYGPRDGIYGWSGIYVKGRNTYIGVYVRHIYRHSGLGKLLLGEAIRICREQNRVCIWQDRKDRDNWVRVFPDGSELREF